MKKCSLLLFLLLPCLTAYSSNTSSSNKDSNKTYGIWINLPSDAITTMDFVDRDNDGVDDRKQPGPGLPPPNKFKTKTRPIQKTIPPEPSSPGTAHQTLNHTMTKLERAIKTKTYYLAYSESYYLLASTHYLLERKPNQTPYKELAETAKTLHAELSKILESPTSTTQTQKVEETFKKTQTLFQTLNKTP